MPARAQPALACTVVGDPLGGSELVDAADGIVRVTALEYATRPPTDVITLCDPRSTIRFRIEEVVLGRIEARELILPGFLNQQNDWNDHSPPYRFVRPDGRSGSCWACNYKIGAQFLLFLSLAEGEPILLQAALAPVNEQIRGENDPWLVWVEEYLADDARNAEGEKSDE